MIAMLAMLVIAPAVQAAEITIEDNIAWWGEIAKLADGSLESRHATNNTGAMFVQRWGDLSRGYICNNWAGNMFDVSNTLGIYNYFVSASLEVKLTDTYIRDDFGLDGVRAYWIRQADTTWGGNYTVPDDWDADQAMDLGWLIPPGVGDEGLGYYSIDITDALWQAHQEFVTSGGVRPYFYVQLVLGNDDGVVYPSSGPGPETGGVSYYVFNTSGGTPDWGFSMTLSDIPEPSVMTIGLVALLALRRKK